MISPSGKYYEDGYRNGSNDKLLGIPMLIIALTSNLDGYSEGYRAGYNRKVKNGIFVNENNQENS